MNGDNDKAASNSVEAKEASNVSSGNGGSCGPIPRWKRELHIKAEATKGVVHESNSYEGSFGLVRRR